MSGIDTIGVDDPVTFYLSDALYSPSGTEITWAFVFTMGAIAIAAPFALVGFDEAAHRESPPSRLAFLCDGRNRSNSSTTQFTPVGPSVPVQ